jgi:predicted flap endonuclease-1-like 5' DNA nuclease
MSTSTLLIIGAAVVVLALVLLVLARSGRKPVEGPADENGIAMVRPATEFAPVLPDEPLPEPAAGLAGGVSPAELAPAPAAVPAGPPDPLTRMKGLGPKAQATLAGLGVTRFDQIAAWNDTDVARIDAEMGAFKGRIVRDRWVEQARYLSADDIAGFETMFGKLGN